MNGMGNDIVSYGYKLMALHERMYVFDPFNTNNPLIRDYIYEINNIIREGNVFTRLIEDEYKNIYRLPISYFSLSQYITLSWIYLIDKMLFCDNSYNTFYGEYADVIELIILSDTYDNKDSIIYRNFDSGLSVFHLASKMYMYNKYKKLLNGELNINLNDEKTYILECYRQLELCLGDDREYCIRYIEDFNGTKLIDYLTNYTNSLVTKLSKI